MLFAGWEVRIVKNCDLNMPPEAAGRGQHFQVTAMAMAEVFPFSARALNVHHCYLFLIFAQTTME